jgi:Spy/CpxP family protein refolding chaperone
MTRHCVLVCLATLCWSTGATARSLCDHQRGDDQKKPQDARPNDPPRWKWWVHPESRKELRLTDQQVKEIDQIFESTMPQQRERMHEIERLDDALSLTIKENTADVATVKRQVEKIEKLRAEERATRTVMIYRIHLVLTPEQRVKVDAIRARLEQERNKRQEDERKRQGRGDKGGHS